MAASEIHWPTDSGKIGLSGIHAAFGIEIMQQDREKERADWPCILILDDDPLSLELLRSALITLPYRVVEAHDGIEALEVLKEQPADLMFVDIQMPHMDGIEFLKHVRGDENFASVPVVAVTANAMAGTDEWAVRKGFDRYLSKPISVKRLRETAKELLAISS